MKSQTRLNSYASILVLLAGFLVGAGGGTADPCLTPDFHELPVVTHWSNSTQAFKYLASDQISSAYLRPAYVPGASYQNGRAYYYYNAKLLPNFEKYIGANFSTVQVPKAEAIKFCQHVFQRTGISLKLLRPDAFDRPEAGLGRLRSLLGTVQVLHGKVIDGSLATIILPPHWDAKAPAGSYPIVFSGLYDLNENVFKAFGEGRSLAEIAALSGTKGNRGAIAVLWNGGDALAGYSVNPSAYRQFASVIDYVASNFSGDRQRILMTGTSRGALISFVMASNPYRGTNAIYDYTVKFVAATAVPAKIGDNFGTMPSATYPWLWKAAFVITGLADTLQPGWTYPAGGHPNLQGFTPAQASLFITTGQSDPDVVNTNLSPISAHFIQGLRESGTQVFLELTAFDIAVPFANQIEYVTKLHEAGIPVQAEVLLRAGHVISRELGLTDNVEGLKNARRQALLKAVLSYVSPTGPVAPKVTPGFSFYRVSRSSTPPSLEPFVPADKLFPFTFEAPRLAKRGESFPLVAVGEPGTKYLAGLLDLTDDRNFITLSQGEIPASAFKTEWVKLPASALVGSRYVYMIHIEKPGQSPQLIPWENTPTQNRVPAVLTVIPPDIPNVSADSIVNAYLEQIPSIRPSYASRGGCAGGDWCTPASIGFPIVSWGVSEY